MSSVRRQKPDKPPISKIRMQKVAADPENPKTQCEEEGDFLPFIDRNRCEGKFTCIEVCPYDVFDTGIIGSAEKSQMNLLGRLKAYAHGGRQAFVVAAERCRGCQLCAAACPEDAISIAQG